MQPRLTRNTDEKMVAGVSGGLAEYFNVDPVIVRLIFVLLTLTSGFGIPVYLVLWVIMPEAKTPQPPAADGIYQAPAQASEARQVMVGQRATVQQRPGVASPERRYDPITGLPINSDPVVGETVHLNVGDQMQLTQHQPGARPRNWSTLGAILLGIGGLILLEQIGLNMSLVFPALLIVAGVVLLLRKR
ncbi:PspC domain-containing protein [Candidatus Gracilibacteria bacterium]|nr:PspC domain-containing protein [Candidatus Gracilibacteria bacterium]